MAYLACTSTRRIRLGLAFIIVAIALPTVSASIFDSTSAGATELFDGWIYNGETVDAGTRVFEVSAGSAGTVAYFESDDIYEFVREDDCKIKDTHAFCTDAIETESTTSRRRAYVRIYRISAVLDVTKTVSTTVPFIGEVIDITQRIDNDGLVEATDIELIDEFPPEFVVDRVQYPCVQADNSVLYKGSITPGNYISCSYEVTPTARTDVTQYTQVTYFDGIQPQTVDVDATTIEINDYFAAELTANATSIALKGETGVELSLTNNHATQDIDILEATIVFPQTYVVTEFPARFKNNGDNTFSIDSQAVLSNTSTYSFKFYATQVTTETIKAHGTYDTTEFVDEFLIESAKISASFTRIEVTAETDSSTKESLQDEKITVWVENDNLETKFKNLVAHFDDNDLVYLSDITMSELRPGRSRKIIDISFKTPNVEESTSYTIPVNISYETEFGQEYSTTFTRTVTVIPVPTIIISHSLSDSSIYSGNSSKLTVSVENTRNADLVDVAVEDNVGVLRARGKHKRTFDLDIDEEVVAYGYHVFAPNVSESTKFPIVTTLTYDFDGATFTHNASSSLTVLPIGTVAEKVRENASLEIKRTLSPTSLSIRDTTKASYTFKNDGTHRLVHATIEFPLVTEFDVSGPLQYFIPSLNPSESITLTSYVTYRPKENGSLILPAPRATFFDEEGTELSAVGENDTLSVSRVSNFTEPAVTLTKSVPSEVEQDTSALINITLENHGTERATVKLMDQGKVWDVTVRGEGTKLIQYRHRFSRLGKQVLDPAYAEYSVLTTNYRTYSDSSLVRVVPRKTPAPAAKEVAPHATNQTTEPESAVAEPTSDISEDVGEEQPIITPKKKPVFKRMVDWVLAFFK